MKILRTAAVVGGMFLLTGCGLSSCDNNGSSQAFNQTVKGENGSQSSVRFGKDAKIPNNFPRSQVPLPSAGPLRAIVAETNPPNSSFTMTYQLGGRNGIQVGEAYKVRLAKAGYKIEHPRSVGGTDGAIIQFDAIGKKWDIAVVSGKASLRDRSTLSVQVHTHGSISSGISGIGDTNPDGGTGSTGSTGSSTTSTTSGF